MPWGAAAAVIGAGVSAASTASAGRSQQRGADAATAEQRRQYDTTRSDNQTGLDARNNSLAQMQELAGTFGSGPTQSQVMNSPGYQFGLSQGRNALEGSASASGGLYSGNAGRALVQYGNDYGTTKYNNALDNMRNSQSDQFNRYASISGQGQLGANAINGAGQNSANNISGIQAGLGNAQGAQAIANGNTWGGLANQLGSTGRSWFGQSSPYVANNTASNYGQTYNASSGATLFADGGPVRKPEDMLAPIVPENKTFNPAEMMKRRIEQDAELQAWKQKQLNGIDPRARVDRAEQQALKGYAGGGAVQEERKEPVVGSKSPVRTSGSGPMGNNALMLMMQEQQEPKTGIAALQYNPVTKPAAVQEQKLRDMGEFSQGGMVHGPGGPKDDSIPAMLSNGEHVIDAASVTALGDGDNEAGQAKLNKLRAMLKGAHRAH